MNHLAERERGRNKTGGEKKKRRKEKKRKKKELSPESNLGPLILRDRSRYAYNSEGVGAATLKGPGENTAHMQGCMQKFCKGGQTCGILKRRAQLQAASGGALEDNVVPTTHKTKFKASS